MSLGGVSLEAVMFQQAVQNVVPLEGSVLPAGQKTAASLNLFIPMPPSRYPCVNR